MPTLGEAIATYHDLLTDELAAESQGQLSGQLRRQGLHFGERPLCTVLRPRFMTPAQYRALQREVGLLLRAFAKAHQAALEDASVRAQFGLLDWEEELALLDPGFLPASPLSRLDTFLLPETPDDPESSAFAITEYNAETPAGSAYNDGLAEVFLALPIMGAFLRHYQVRPLPARHQTLHALLAAHRQRFGRGMAPRIAILDWREVPTYSEHVLFRDYFAQHGIACVTADPREVEYRDGRLWAGDFAITLIYKRVLISELIARGGRDHPVVRAVRDGAVCMVNPFACKLLHKKASLAVLSDERNAALFDTAERQAIAAHVPWTRRVEERRTQHGERTVDLVDFILAEREHLVLKANDEYGGKGIVLGWLCDDHTWEQALRTALAEPFVVQERVAIPAEAYPSLEDGRVRISERIMDTAPFVFDGAAVDGCLTRLSTEALVNVTAGGGSSVPTFLVEPR